MVLLIYKKYWIVELAICTVKPFDSTCTCQCDLHVLYMHLVLLGMLGIHVHVLVITELSFFFTCRMERITLQEMWKYMNSQGGYSIAAINVVNFIYEYNFIALPRLTSNFI